MMDKVEEIRRRASGKEGHLAYHDIRLCQEDRAVLLVVVDDLVRQLEEAKQEAQRLRRSI